MVLSNQHGIFVAVVVDGGVRKWLWCLVEFKNGNIELCKRMVFLFRCCCCYSFSWLNGIHRWSPANKHVERWKKAYCAEHGEEIWTRRLAHESSGFRS